MQTKTLVRHLVDLSRMKVNSKETKIGKEFLEEQMGEEKRKRKKLDRTNRKIGRKNNHGNKTKKKKVKRKDK